MCSETRLRAQENDNLQAMESLLTKSSNQENGHELLQDPSIMQSKEDSTKTGENADFGPMRVLIAGGNILNANSIIALPRLVSVPNSIMTYLIMSVAIAFVSSLVSLGLQSKKAAAPFMYVSSVFMGSTAAILLYYLYPYAV